MGAFRLALSPSRELHGVALAPHELFVLLDERDRPAGRWLRLHPGAFAGSGYPGGLSALEVIEHLGDAAPSDPGGGAPRDSQLVVLEWPAEFLRRTDAGRGLPGSGSLERALAVFQVTRVSGLTGVQWDTRALEPEQVLATGLVGDPLEGHTGAHEPFHPTPLAAPVGHPHPDARLSLVHGWFRPEGSFDSLAGRPDLLRRAEPPSPAVVLVRRGLLGLFGAMVVLCVVSAIHVGQLWLRTSRVVQPVQSATAPDDAVQEYLAIAVCSADNPEFMRRLKCNVRRLADGSLPLSEALTSDCLDSETCGGSDVQAMWCGLADRGDDGWGADLLPGTADGVQDFSQLALAQACFDTLGGPAAYALGQDDQLVDVERMLSPETGVMAATLLAEELQAACDGYRPLLERRVDGAILATHIGRPFDLREPPVEDAQILRHKAYELVTEPWDDLQRICFEHGMVSGIDVKMAASICGASGNYRPAFARGPGWKALGSALDPLARGREACEGRFTASESYLTTYARGRYGTTMGRLPRSGRWACHANLEGLAERVPGVEPVRGQWGVPLRVPSRYDVRGDSAEYAQLGLESALVGMRAGAELGACWSVVDGLLTDWPTVHPLYEPLDEQGWPVAAQQVCGQVCMGWYLDDPRLLDSHWVAARNDVYRCVQQACPCEGEDGVCDALGTPCFEVDSEFPALAMPWNGQSVGRPPGAAGFGGWVLPQTSEVCAFHLIAQDRLSLGDGEWFPGDLSGAQWAGEALGLPGVAGGPDGAAMGAALAFSRDGAASTWGRTECGAVALQCFAGEAMRTRRTTTSPSSRTAWEALFLDAIGVIARSDAEEVAREHPWCALVHPFLLPAPRADTLDAPCREGVSDARQSVLETIGSLAATGLPRPDKEAEP